MTVIMCLWCRLKTTLDVTIPKGMKLFCKRGWFVSLNKCTETLGTLAHFFFLGTDPDRTLQEKNEGLHQSLVKTAVRMEFLGEEFMSSQKLLEAELQKTRMELGSLTDRFKR